MKRVVPGLLLLPLLTSCVVQEGYYAPGYYPPPPPPPYVEVHRYEAPRHEHGHHHGYRPAPKARVYQGHDNNYGTAHANVPAPVPGNARVVKRPDKHAVVVNPHQQSQNTSRVNNHASNNTNEAPPDVRHNNVEQHN